MELGLTIDLVLFSLLTVLLVTVSINEAREEKKAREEKVREVKKAA